MEQVKSFKEIEELIQKVQLTRLCIGFTDKDGANQRRAKHCTGHLPFGAPLSKVRCLHCSDQNRRLRKIEKGLQRKIGEKKKTESKKKGQKIRRLKQKVIF